jgi:hypothetical protein
VLVKERGVKALLRLMRTRSSRVRPRQACKEEGQNLEEADLKRW